MQPRALPRGVATRVLAAATAVAAAAVATAPPTACGICPGGNASGAVGDFPGARLAATTSPTGNDAPTATAFTIQGVTGEDDEREYLVSVGLLSNRGNASRPTPYHDKVALYAGIVAAPGTGDVWAFNPLVTQSAASGSYNAQGIELDFNNENAHRGDADAGAGLAPPVSYGLSVSGAAPFRSTSAILVSGPGDHPIWNRGVVFANDCVAQSTFQDLGNPAKSVDIRGAPTYGVYQSNAGTKNYFAGPTGVGAGAEAPDARAALHVAGDLRVDGRVRLFSSGSGNSGGGRGKGGSGGAPPRAVVLLAATTAAAADVIVSTGTARLDATGAAVVALPPDAVHVAAAAAAAAAVAVAYALTPIGAPMPALHVLDELSVDGADGPRFSVAGGAPHGRVSWHVTVTISDSAGEQAKD